LTATFKNISKLFGLAALAFFSFLMLRIIFYYIPPQDDVAFLQLKQEYIHIDSWRIAFFIHVYTSMLVLLAGFTQFSGRLLRQQPKLHRLFGYIYIIDVLMITGPAGMLMSFYANGGISSRIAFVLLSVLWMGSTAMALYQVKKKDFTAHRSWMIRSYALTLSAVTLRIWKVVLANYTDIHPLDRYRIIAWLGWGLNLLLAEGVIYYYREKNSKLTVCS